MEYRPEELLITVIARLLEGCGHIAAGVSSPVPGSAALLRRELDGGESRVSIIGHLDPTFRTDGGVEFFDCAGQGRIDAFFLSGGQVDGAANINLVGVGDYPRQRVRWAGSFGSGYLYYMVPRVILFREEHSPRVLVPRVDFISSPGVSEPDVHRPGGPQALVTTRCLFSFDRDRRRFRLESVHAGHTVDEVRENTGFEFDCPAQVPETPPPEPDVLQRIREVVAPQIAGPYPRFAERVFGIAPQA